MIRTGTPGAYQQPSAWGRNESGNFETWSFEGTPQEIRNTAAAFSQVSGLSYHVQEGFGKWRLEVQFPWNQDGLVLPSTDTIIKWEMFAQHADKDLLTAQDNAGYVKTLNLAQKEIIRNKLLQPPQQGTTTVADFQKGLGGNAANALLLYTIMQAGQQGYLMEAPALRRTIITNAQYAIAYSIAFSRKILSTVSLYSFEQVPSALLFNLNTLLSGDVSSDPNLNYGWYKFFPNVQQIALLKWSITQEWQYGWWTLPYSAPL